MATAVIKVLHLTGDRSLLAENISHQNNHPSFTKPTVLFYKIHDNMLLACWHAHIPYWVFWER